MSRTFDADEIQLDQIRIISGTADPTAGGGLSRAIGSLYARAQAGAVALYQKLTAPNTGWQALVQGLAWKSVKDYGATGDGVTDDTAAIQQAITDTIALGGGVVYFPQGIYLVSQLAIANATGVQLIGAGPGTVLKWTFNAGAAAGSMVTVSGTTRGFVCRGIRFDGSGLSNPDAARGNHLLRFDSTGGSIVESHVVQCWFGGMIAASGDGVHVVGAAGALVSRIWIRDNVFDGCSRWSVGMRQGIQYAWVIDNFATNCETEIAIVANANVNTDCVQIANNQLVHTSGTVRHALRLEGDATGLITRLACANNIVLNGFVSLSAIQYASIAGNQIYSGVYASADAVVLVQGGFFDSVLSKNLISRSTGATAGPCLQVQSAGGVAPSRFITNGNQCVQQVASAGLIVLVDVTRAIVAGNLMRNTDAGATTVYAIDVQAVTVAANDILIGGGNQVTAAAGTFAAFCRLLANGANVNVVSIVSNQGNQIDTGVRYEVGGGGGNFTTNQIMQAGNNINASTADFANVGGAGVIPRVGFNAGTFGAQLFEGDGSPEGVVTARIGSMYLRRDGGQATAVYYKESTTVATGWVAIGGSAIVFGTGDTTTAATAVYFGPGYIATSIATEIQMPVTRPATIRNLRVQVAGAGTGAQTVTFTVRKNGVDTALTCTIGNTSTGLTSDTTHSFTVVAGDLLSVSILKAAGVAAGQTNVIASMEMI